MDTLARIADQIKQQKQPPVDQWKPTQSGEIDIKIDSMGFWSHEGDRIDKSGFVNLFSSILWFEAGQYYLVTPVEKLAIEVADVPFIIQQVEWVDGVWVATTNTQQQLFIGKEHPVELRLYQQQLVPYVRVRYALWARVNRSIYYQWVCDAMAQQDSDNQALLLYSGKYQFEVAR